MTVETLLPNGVAGWPTGVVGNIDNTIASASGTFYETSIQDDVATIDLAATVIVDGDTVNSVTVKVHAMTTGAGGKDAITVDVLIGGTPQASQTMTGFLTGSSSTFTFTNALWNSDWTAAQIAGMQLTLTAVQTGKATAADWQVDEIEVDIDYTEAAVCIAVPVVHHHHSLMR